MRMKALNIAVLAISLALIPTVILAARQKTAAKLVAHEHIQILRAVSRFRTMPVNRQIFLNCS